MRSRLCAAVLLALVGCAGSGGGEHVTAPREGHSEGSEPLAAAPAEEPAAAASEVAAPAPAGPSTITVEVRVNEQPASAQVRLLAGGEEAASAQSGTPITIESGEYTMEVQISDDSLVDRPLQRRALTLLPGGEVTETVEFPWAMIQLKVRVNGALDRSAKVDLLRNGAVVATLGSDAPHVPISPGRYAAVVKTRRAEIEVKELMFPQGATQSVPVAVQM